MAESTEGLREESAPEVSASSSGAMGEEGSQQTDSPPESPVEAPVEAPVESLPPIAEPKKRGRPPGAKNKPKPAEEGEGSTVRRVKPRTAPKAKAAPSPPPQEPQEPEDHPIPKRSRQPHFREIMQSYLEDLCLGICLYSQGKKRLVKFARLAADPSLIATDLL